jgi:hypothetical protein
MPEPGRKAEGRVDMRTYTRLMDVMDRTEDGPRG